MKSIFEEMGGTYTLGADGMYYPNLVLTEEERRMWQALTDMSEGHVSELASKSGIPAFKARSVLSALEVKGLAVSLGGNRYAPL